MSNTIVRCEGHEDCTADATFVVATPSELSRLILKQVNVCSDHARAYTENLGYRILWGPANATS